MNEEADAPLRDPLPIATAGSLLRIGRAASGLSIDAVAQQLKLAPRQVRALEDDDFAQLPGRTFVRGFVRNYARLLRLDIDAVLAALPDTVAAPLPEGSSLAPSPRVMGELPAYLQNKPSPARWAIAFALLAVVAVVAGYEYMRPGSSLARALHGDKTGSLPAIAAATEPSRPVDTAPSPPAPLSESVTSARETPPTAPNAAGKSESASPASGAAVLAAAAVPGDAPLMLSFTGTSWVEVKDAKGAVVLATIGYPGAAHAVGGTPPFEVVLGNAEAVIVTYRGVPFDSTPFIKQNVAKFALK